MIRLFLISVLMLVSASTAWAQTVTTVTATSQAQFNASPDHAVIDSFNRPLVDSYDLRIVVQGSTTLVFTKALGKPTPNAEGIINVVVPEFGKLTANTIHTAQVFVVGPGGAVGSNISNPFGVAGTLAAPRAPTGLVVVQ